MRRILMTTAAAVIAMPAMTAAGFAQTADTTTEQVPTAQATGNATGTTDATGTTAQTQAQSGTTTRAPGAAATGQANAQGTAGMSVENVVSSIEDSSKPVQAISDSSVKRIGVVLIDERAGEEALSQVDQAVEDNPDQVSNLQEAIRGNATLSSQIEGGGLKVDSIVAAYLTPTNDLILFTRS